MPDLATIFPTRLSAEVVLQSSHSARHAAAVQLTCDPQRGRVQLTVPDGGDENVNQCCLVVEFNEQGQLVVAVQRFDEEATEVLLLDARQTFVPERDDLQTCLHGHRRGECPFELCNWH